MTKIYEHEVTLATDIPGYCKAIELATHQGFKKGDKITVTVERPDPPKYAIEFRDDRWVMYCKEGDNNWYKAFVFPSAAVFENFNVKYKF